MTITDVVSFLAAIKKTLNIDGLFFNVSYESQGVRKKTCMISKKMFSCLIWVFISISCQTTSNLSKQKVLISKFEKDETEEESFVTKHFRILWNKDNASEEEVTEVGKVAESAFEKYKELLSSKKITNTPITIILGGDASKNEFPTVSPKTGNILLYRYPGSGGEHSASLAHELMHALRIHLWTEAVVKNDVFLFIEEGFAEIMARESGFPSTGFPLFGISAIVAAGQWFKHNEQISITKLATRHNELNFRCMPQAYTLRLSFFSYLKEQFGLPKMIDLAYSKKEMSESSFKVIYGIELKDLATAWEQDLEIKYKSSPRVNALTKLFREHPAIKYFPRCEGNTL